MPAPNDVSERSQAPLMLDHLDRLALLARLDRKDRFERHPRWLVYRDRVLLVALCQGAALHYLDRRTGVKDLDVWTFYAAHPTGPFPPRWPLPRCDFGPSELGRHPDDIGFTGRHVDLVGRSLDVPVNAEPVEAVRHYLRTSRGTSPRMLARKAVIALDPPELRGSQVWPIPST